MPSPGLPAWASVLLALAAGLAALYGIVIASLFLLQRQILFRPAQDRPDFARVEVAGLGWWQRPPQEQGGTAGATPGAARGPGARLEKPHLVQVQMLTRGKAPSGGLSSAMGYFKLHFKGKAHRADVDAANTLALFFKLLERQAKLESILDSAKTV